jgi:hypothetical protein
VFLQGLRIGCYLNATTILDASSTFLGLNMMYFLAQLLTASLLESFELTTQVMFA